MQLELEQAKPIEAPQTIMLEFDGGCQPNPGQRYGSWLATINGESVSACTRQEFGYGTNNEAEFLALEQALYWLSVEPAHRLNQVFIWTDSMIVYWRLNPDRKVKKPGLPGTDRARMDEYAGRCLFLLKRFRNYAISWRSRAHNVATFGH